MQNACFTMTLLFQGWLGGTSTTRTKVVLSIVEVIFIFFHGIFVVFFSIVHVCIPHFFSSLGSYTRPLGLDARSVRARPASLLARSVDEALVTLIIVLVLVVVDPVRSTLFRGFGGQSAADDAFEDGIFTEVVGSKELRRAVRKKKVVWKIVDFGSRPETYHSTFGALDSFLSPGPVRPSLDKVLACVQHAHDRLFLKAVWAFP